MMCFSVSYVATHFEALLCYYCYYTECLEETVNFYNVIHTEL